MTSRSLPGLDLNEFVIVVHSSIAFFATRRTLPALDLTSGFSLMSCTETCTEKRKRAAAVRNSRAEMFPRLLSISFAVKSKTQVSVFGR